MRQFKITPNITNRESQSLDKYLEEVRWQELIDALKEVELAKKIKQGDQKALDTLVKANLRFVVSVAKQYQNQWLPLPDLINEGNLGLIKAAEKFDETRWFKFISYAVRWIRQTILHALATNSRIVRVPLNVIWDQNKIHKFTSHFLQEHHREPSTKEIAYFLDIPEDAVNNILSGVQRTTSLDAPVWDDSYASTLADTLENNEFPSVDDEFNQQSLTINIQRLLDYFWNNAIFYRERRILELYYWLNGNREHTLEEIGPELGLSGERVRQLKEKAIRRLRQVVKRGDLKNYI